VSNDRPTRPSLGYTAGLVLALIAQQIALVVLVIVGVIPTS
jgi:hypothetical protein